MRKLPPLATLPAFEATARLGSVSAAARELGRTHGAISKQIRNLSDDVGGDLFEKQGTGLKLTERGERLRRLLTPLLDDLEATTQGLRREVDDRHVDVAASATLAMRWLTPRLPAFYACHPEVDIRLHMSGPKRVRDQEIDVVLSYDRLRGSLWHPDKRALGDAAYGPVCAPAYRIERSDRVATVEARLTQPSAARIWQGWEELSGFQLVASREVEHPHHFLAIEAASAGLGLAMAERRIVAGDLSAGRLIAPFGFVTVKDGFQAAVMPRAAKRRSAAALLAWLAEAAREEDG